MRMEEVSEDASKNLSELTDAIIIFLLSIIIIIYNYNNISCTVIPSSWTPRLVRF